MFAKFFAVAVLAVLGLLAGCATVIPQPTVSDEVRKELSGKDIKSFTVYVVNRDIMDVSKAKSQSYRDIDFAEYFKNYLRKEGFAVSDSPCKSCVEIAVDARYTKWDALNIFFGSPGVTYGVRVTLAYNGQPLMVNEGGWYRGVLWGGQYNEDDRQKMFTPIVGWILEKWSTLSIASAASTGGSTSNGTNR